MTELSIEERVAKGVAWLDEHQPGWMELVDLATLDVESCALCVLGQLFGHFLDAPSEAKYDLENDRPSEAAFERGFEAFSGSEEYAALTGEWRRLIESRRAAS